MRLAGLEAAKRFVSENFPDCRVAFLSGSAARGEDRLHSDLDILIISEAEPAPYIAAFSDSGWLIEVLMHNRESYKKYFEQDRLRGRPSLPHMFATGVILADDGTAAAIQQEARDLLAAGPPPWSQREIDFARFVITNHLLDLEDGLPPVAAMFAVNELAYALHELVLRANRRWIGKGKRIIPALRAFDPGLAQEFADTMEKYFAGGDAAEVIRFADRILEPFGGRLFAGYSSKGT
ncbi:nucleotidyltransferase [Alicyclobacillus cellulosilyticus]|uniref:Nucleotidyltransferase n=1 Tax=Alicyclobacillus cellulosilyticus TaxID=1003997 RepID=A0A917KE46_9BACL|nr:nucleotidyltransferase domain-containing protein [Alicyclobacillus cellulosilyticus]GGJ07174.1 nucleotidyltransferase [Alicyclobacillus cellulosilyticus]